MSPKPGGMQFYRRNGEEKVKEDSKRRTALRRTKFRTNDIDYVGVGTKGGDIVSRSVTCGMGQTVPPICTQQCDEPNATPQSSPYHLLCRQVLAQIYEAQSH